MKPQINAMLDVLYRQNGEPATYVDADGGTRAVSAFIERNLSTYGDIAEVRAGSVLVSVRASEVPNRPRRDDTFALADGETLYVDNVMIADGFEYRCMAHGR